MVVIVVVVVVVVVAVVVAVVVVLVKAVVGAVVVVATQAGASPSSVSHPIGIQAALYLVSTTALKPTILVLVTGFYGIKC